MSDLIDRQEALDAIKKCRNESNMPDMWYDGMSCALRCIFRLPSVQPKSYREGYQAGFKDAQPESCKDAVSRSRVKLLLARLRDAVDDGYGFNYQSAVDELRDMPPAQPERIRGRWGTTVASPTLIVCNRCGRTVLKNGSVHWNFCPTCGAEMEVSK